MRERKKKKSSRLLFTFQKNSIEVHYSLDQVNKAY